MSTEYKGVLEPISIECWCGKEFIKPFHQFKDYQTQDCGNHHISNGEAKIMNYLEENNISYEPQYTFEDCKNDKVLRFDFGLINEDGSLNKLIEFHGIQHYEPKGFGIKDESRILDKFNRQLANDNIKESYCRKNGIELVIIPYWEKENLYDILDKVIS